MATLSKKQNHKMLYLDINVAGWSYFLQLVWQFFPKPTHKVRADYRRSISYLAKRKYYNHQIFHKNCPTHPYQAPRLNQISNNIQRTDDDYQKSVLRNGLVVS